MRVWPQYAGVPPFGCLSVFAPALPAAYCPQDNDAL